MSISSIWKKVLLYLSWKIGLAAVVVLGIGWTLFGGSGGVSGPTLVVHSAAFNEQVSVAGTVVASQDVDLGFAESGRIGGVYVKVGTRVAQGALLANIENGELLANLHSKQALLAREEATLASLSAGTRPEEIAVDQAAVDSAHAKLLDAIRAAYTASDDAVHNRVDTFFTNPRTSPKLILPVNDAGLVSKVESERATLEREFTSWSSQIASLSDVDALASATAGHLTRIVAFLADTNTVLNQVTPNATYTTDLIATYATTAATARTNVDTATTNFTITKTALESAEKSLALAQAGSTPETLAEQKAQVASAEADVASASAALLKTQVLAPFAGVVSRMDAKAGTIASPSTSLISIQSMGAFEIEAYVPELSISAVAIGDSASTTLDAYGTASVFHARVITVDPAETVKDGVPTYKTTLLFDTVDPRIRSGMTANVVITTGIKPGAIVVPLGAVFTKLGQNYVDVVVGRKIEERKVTTGLTNALGLVEVESGLEDGETILLAPH